MNQKNKKNLPSTGRLGKTSHTSDMLVNTAKDIISHESDPVKLIGDLIQYQRLSAKMYRENTRVK